MSTDQIFAVLMVIQSAVIIALHAKLRRHEQWHIQLERINAARREMEKRQRGVNRRHG